MAEDDGFPATRDEKSFVGSIFGLVGVLTMATAPASAAQSPGAGLVELLVFGGVLIMILG